MRSVRSPRAVIRSAVPAIRPSGARPRAISQFPQIASRASRTPPVISSAAIRLRTSLVMALAGRATRRTFSPGGRMSPPTFVVGSGRQTARSAGKLEAGRLAAEDLPRVEMPGVPEGVMLNGTSLRFSASQKAVVLSAGVRAIGVSMSTSSSPAGDAGVSCPTLPVATLR